MMIRLLLATLIMVAGSAYALQPPNVPGLLPMEIARPLLEQDPRVAAARAGLEVAKQEASILDKSPYEWTGKALGQRRSLDTGPRYREWNVGIERTIRLPGKGSADRNIGKATIEESEARYGEALHESARELASLWVDWLAAERGRELAASNLVAVQENLKAVDKRLRAGDASKLDLNLASAELAEQKRMDNDARTQASAAWARLSVRFPGINRQSVLLPAPMLIAEDEALWRDRIIGESDELKVVQTQLRIAQAQADRAQADRVPDPTFGVYTASEVGGRERISGITLSIPLPGGLRDSRSSKALAAVEVARNAADLKKRELETEIASALVTARGTYESLQIANEGALAMQENAKLVQRAYALGEGDLQTLLLARRQTTAAANSALLAQVGALKAYYGLLIDAHLIWGLDSE
ncbi:MAG: TolC family protein [Polaromonas sp.]|uniref:TolC family protein n=1 Tax=Polaromonas sp. TaxID=1869339 RepID=UPI00248A369B|nr:TolC family protein [Polaromonas sp.]MDI1238169.1 TolC family protein [Polaromonas sp.]MDP2451794.1 TolC family protein [Polaromonas sp.]MDP3248745.1 TolC family protein [Polaromonas sp.]